MQKPESLDELISNKAVEFADQIRAAAAMADKEEEIRIESEKQLAFIQKAAGIKLEGKHEFTVASGRIDSVYDRVIIEYKNPSDPGARIGQSADTPGSRKVVEQIKKRFYDMRSEHGQALNTLFGVGLDGNHFVFIRFRDDKWHIQPPVEVNKYSAQRFLWALFNLGTKGKPFSPEYLAGDFGSGSKVAQKSIRSLYESISSATHPKAKVFFNQWKILFAEVCGYDVDNPSEKMKALASSYNVPVTSLKSAELLFALHTYYAIFMKLLASEIVAFFHKLPTPLSKMIAATTSNKLKYEMTDLEAGSIFRHLNITNFLEGDLFAWYTSVWSEQIEGVVRDMITQLDNYNPGTLSEDPTGSRDLLKKLYHELFPKNVRHDLGEYYTPDWLSEHIFDELEYTGDPNMRLLDPACGSGTFLVMAINRIRSWYDQNREMCHFGEGELCRKILSNLVGFDLNPLAVMAARTNYLIAIRDLIGYVDKVEIPVYLCDSIITPSEYGELFAGKLGNAKELKTAAARFMIPTEITTNPGQVANYAELLESCVKNGYSAEEFLERCRDENLPVEAHTLHIGLYDELVRLDKANMNGVWARIIKNAFAPLFVGSFDYVAGNPPWVFWNNLPSEYRNQVRILMADTYQITAKRASTMKKLGAAGKDLSMLFFYVALDKYLRENGKLGYVITQTIFQTTAGNEFRRFRLPASQGIGVIKVEDWVRVQPFRPKAGNKTATIVAQKGMETVYPVPYEIFEPVSDFDREASSLEEVMLSCSQTLGSASPHDPNDVTSFWVIETDSEASLYAAPSTSNVARRGIETTLESVFRVRVQKRIAKDLVLVENIRDRAKIPVEQVNAAIEDGLLLPYVTGASVRRWSFQVAGYYVTPHTAQTGMSPIPLGEMKYHYPKTFAYFNQFREQLERRTLHQRWGKNNPFYSMYNIGPYTFMPFKVAWKRSTRDFGAVVLSTINDPILGARIVVPNGKIMIVAFDNEEEAHFLCGLVNSGVARSRINAAITSEAHKDIINVVPLERFKSKKPLHKKISDLSLALHSLSELGKSDELKVAENELDAVVRKLWGIH